ESYRTSARDPHTHTPQVRGPYLAHPTQTHYSGMRALPVSIRHTHTHTHTQTPLPNAYTHTRTNNVLICLYEDLLMHWHTPPTTLTLSYLTALQKHVVAFLLSWLRLPHKK